MLDSSLRQIGLLLEEVSISDGTLEGAGVSGAERIKNNSPNGLVIGMRGGKKVVVKSAGKFGFSKREHQAYLLSSELGLGVVPKVELLTVGGVELSIQDYVGGGGGGGKMVIWGKGGAGGEDRKSGKLTPQLIPIVILDYLAFSLDRGIEKNIIKTAGKWWAIDNESCFRTVRGAKVLTLTGQWGQWGPFVASLLSCKDEGFDKKVTARAMRVLPERDGYASILDKLDLEAGEKSDALVRYDLLKEKGSLWAAAQEWLKSAGLLERSMNKGYSFGESRLRALIGGVQHLVEEISQKEADSFAGTGWIADYHKWTMPDGTVVGADADFDVRKVMGKFGVSFKDKTVLDAGCLAGGISFDVIQQGAASVLAVNRSATELAVANKAHKRLKEEFPDAGFDRLTFKKAEIMNLDLDEKFDVVIFMSVLHWAREPMKMLERVAGWVKPGGVMLLEQDLDDGPDGIDEIPAKLPDGKGPFPRGFGWYFTDRAMRKGLADVGFSSVEYRGAVKMESKRLYVCRKPKD